jgi:hypothetical protein
MMSLHRECLPRRVALVLNTSRAELGTSLFAGVQVSNQNERIVYGRAVLFDGPVTSEGEPFQLTAWYPKDEPQQVRAKVTDFIFADAPLTVPVFKIPLTVSANRRVSWRSFAAANGPGGTFTDHAAPTAPPAGCPEYVRYDNADGSWVTFAAYC